VNPLPFFGEDEFKSIKLKITDAPININKVIVYYESGETREIPMSSVLQAGAETGTFSLESPDDELKKISFTYIKVSQTTEEKKLTLNFTD
jgi:hypothetical protein